MSAIRGKDTEPERRVRSALHHMGYRFRLHVSDLPGRPDVVMARHRTVVFVHGCFWHQHPGCAEATKPGTRVEYWTEKFRRNRIRDRRVERSLRSQGWRVVTLWDCETREGLIPTLRTRLPNRIRH